MTSIGVALSGGGHRAALFGLGVLMYLIDSGQNRSVAAISSVSGGSLTNGYVAQSVDFKAATTTEFEPVARGLVRQIVRRGTLWTFETKAYVTVLGMAGFAAVATPWFVPVSWPLRAVIFAAGIAAAGWLAGKRGSVCIRAFSKTLFHEDDRPTRLSGIHTSVDHVLCAAELNWGEHVYLSGRFVCAYRYGFGGPGTLKLAEAVHASAAYPGGFPARWISAEQFGFAHPGDHRAPAIRQFGLVDGGVYDNMADEWALGLSERKTRWPHARFSPIDELVVVNSTGDLDTRALKALKLPLFGEVLTLRRDVDLLYDTTTSVRRRWLHGLFVASDTKGAIIQISQSPFDVPTEFSNRGDDAARRAGSVLGALAGTRNEWRERAGRSSHVPTTLNRISAPVAADVIHHGYVLAMANLHVVLGYPLLELPPTDRFLELVGGNE